jgi:hypothetical protein
MAKSAEKAASPLPVWPSRRAHPALPDIVASAPGVIDIHLGWGVVRVIEDGLYASVVLHLAGDDGPPIPVSRCNCEACRKALN